MKNKVLCFKSKAWAAPRNGGFTLMEILFVLLVIALIISFAVPAFRAVRFDVKNARAQAALKKLAEARHSFYQYSKGSDIDTSANKRSFTGDAARGMAGEACLDTVSSGIPASSRHASEVSQLFACGFLNWRDFAGLPYTFYVCPLSSSAWPCVVPDYLQDGLHAGEFVYAAAVGTGAADAGAKYTTLDDGKKYYMYVRPDMQVKDNLE